MLHDTSQLRIRMVSTWCDQSSTPHYWRFLRLLRDQMYEVMPRVITLTICTRQVALYVPTDGYSIIYLGIKIANLEKVIWYGLKVGFHFYFFLLVVFRFFYFTPSHFQDLPIFAKTDPRFANFCQYLPIFAKAVAPTGASPLITSNKQVNQWRENPSKI